MQSSDLAQLSDQLDDAEHAELVEADRKLRIDLAVLYAKQKNVLGWGKMLFPDKFYLPFCHKLHDYLIDIRLLPLTDTEAPRNHAKTLIRCFLCEIFQALEEPKLFLHYLNVQATKEKALAINTAIRGEIETNEELRAIYGDQVGYRKWTDGQFVLRNGVIFTAVSAGQSIRGINYDSIRPDYIVVDDLYDEEDINNPDATEKKNNWFWGSLYPARAKSRRNCVHVQGTAINNYDILKQLSEKDRWKARAFQAVEDWDKKIVLWPELNTLDSLEKDKIDMGSIIFNREMQNERQDEKEAKIKLSWLKDWEFDPIDLKRELAEGRKRIFVGVLMGNDPSIGKDSESDDTGTAVVWKTAWVDSNMGGNDYWIMDVVGEKLSLLERINQLERMAAAQPPEYPVTNVRIEAIAAFDDYASEAIRKTNLPIERVEWVKDKITTLEVKSHYFENGKVHLNKNIEPRIKDMLIHQLTTNHPKHDDLRDAVLLTLDDTSGIWRFV